MEHTAPAADAASRVEDAREIMTTEEVAALLQLAPDTLLRWRKDGTGPKYSQPSRNFVRYLRDDVLAWLREHRA